MEAIADALRDLTARWKGDAGRMTHYGAELQAVVLLQAADDVLAVLATVEDDRLTLVEAARASGYSAEHLGRLVRQGKIPNAGRAHAPRIRRADLPRKTSQSLREHPKNDSIDSPRRRIARAILTEASNG